MEKFPYDRELDIRLNTADYFIINSVRNNSKVLEIGTSTGYMSKYLSQEKKCEVSGVEFNSEAFHVASQYMTYSFNEDLNSIVDWHNKLFNNYYDYVIFQDVLEHLTNPIHVMDILVQKLAYRGQFLISIPNASHNLLLMELLKNRFTYKNNGLLDDTHYKWYTSDSFKKEIDKLGLKMISHYITYMAPKDSGWELNYNDFSLIQKEVLLGHNNAHVFQNLFVLGRPYEYEEVEDAILLTNSVVDYDEMHVIEANNVYSYIYDYKKWVVHNIKQDCNQISICPTIRAISYKIFLEINKVSMLLSMFDTNNGLIDGNTQDFISFADQIFRIKYNFKQGDEVRVCIEKSDSALEQSIRGDINVSNLMNKMKGLINKNSTISFDIFDTLVLRNVLFPKDIFKLMDKYAKTTHNIEDFYNFRIDCEMFARTIANDEDILLDEIYDVMERRLGEDVSDIKQLELELECKFIVVNPFMKEIYDYAIENNKDIYIISDMYLPKSFLEPLLNNLGYKGYKELYISGEQKKTKATLTIYEYLKHSVNIETKSWLHIGDNYQSDVKNPQSLGINAFYYKAPRDVIMEKDEGIDIKSSIMRALQINKLFIGYEVPYWMKFGMLHVAPIFYGFADWLARCNINSDNLVFLSRDGYMPKIVFDMIKKARGLDNIQSVYLYTSRKAYQLPAMAYLTKNEFIEMSTQWNAAFGHIFTIKEAFSNLNLNFQDYIHEMSLFGFESGSDIVSHENRHNLKKLIALVYEDANAALKRDAKLVFEYLRQENITQFNTVNLCDIGWRGSIQHAIKLIMEEEGYKNTINGFYFGTNNYVHSAIVDNTYGYLVDYGIPRQYYEFCSNNIMHMELIFTAPQPQLMRFKKSDDKKISPVFRNFVENQEYSEQFHKAAILMIEEFLEWDEYITGISAGSCIQPLQKFINEKRYDDLLKFSKISNYISYDTECKPYVLTVSEKDLLNKFEEIMQDASVALWKDAFIIEGIDSEADYINFLNNNETLKNKLQTLHTSAPVNDKILSFKNVKKAIRNPFKAIRYILRYLSKE